MYVGRRIQVRALISYYWPFPFPFLELSKDSNMKNSREKGKKEGKVELIYLFYLFWAFLYPKEEGGSLLWEVAII